MVWIKRLLPDHPLRKCLILFPLVSQMKKLFPIVPAERPEGAPVFEEKQKRMETDLMVVHQKGVTFVQVRKRQM